MIHVETRMDVADNTGALNALCIKVLKNKKHAKIGDEVVITVKKAKPNTTIKKGEIHKAVLIRIKKEIIRLEGSNLIFNTNDAILLNTEKEPLGNRVVGPIALELRDTKFLKVVSLAQYIL